MTPRQSKWLITAMLLFSWLPATGALQAASYLAPLALCALFLLMGGRLDRNSVRALFVFLVLVMLSVLFNIWNFYPSNLALALVTYSPWILVLLSLRGAPNLVSFIATTVARISIFQCLLGIGQLLVRTGGSLVFSGMDAGDAVVGTLLDNSHLFSIKMMLAVLFLGVCAFRGDRRRVVVWGLLASLLGIVLASALLTTVIFLTASTAFFLLGPKAFFQGYSLERLVRIRAAALIGLMLVVAVFSVVQRDNMLLIARYSQVATEALQGGRQFGLNKVLVAIDSCELLVSSPSRFLFGYGLGHYSSRAAMIASGGYLRNQPDFLPVRMSEATYEHIYPYWNQDTWSVEFQDGVMNQPFFSIQSVALELGAPALIALFALFFQIYRRASQAVGSSPFLVANYFILPLSVVFPSLLFSENWLEYPHVAAQLGALILLARVERTEADRVKL